jgi:catechol 2,3-dioxygenase-like lactoylglutathione lyase family enzyme
VIGGAHVIIFATDAVAARTFVQEKLGFRAVDAGEGWLIFELPPAELAFHPAERDGDHELYLMCDDIERTRVELEEKGVEFSGPVSDEAFGRLAKFKVDGAGELALYEPGHPSPLDRFG